MDKKTFNIINKMLNSNYKEASNISELNKDLSSFDVKIGDIEYQYEKNYNWSSGIVNISMLKVYYNDKYESGIRLKKEVYNGIYSRAKLYTCCLVYV